jgi:hypothetical protein
MAHIQLNDIKRFKYGAFFTFQYLDYVSVLAQHHPGDIFALVVSYRRINNGGQNSGLVRNQRTHVN